MSEFHLYNSKIKLSERIETVMAERGMRTRQDLAKAANDPTLNSVYSDELKVGAFLKICTALDHDPDYILAWEPQRLKAKQIKLFLKAQTLSKEDQWMVVDLIRRMTDPTYQEAKQRLANSDQERVTE